MFVPNVHDCLVLRVESTSKPQEGQARERVWALQVFRTWADLLRLHNQLTASKLRPRQRLAESLTSRLKSPAEGIICKQLAFKVLLGSSWLWGRPDVCRPCTARMQTCRELSWPPLYSSSFSEAKPINLRMPSSHQDPMTVQAQISQLNSASLQREPAAQQRSYAPHTLAAKAAMVSKHSGKGQQGFQ